MINIVVPSTGYTVIDDEVRTRQLMEWLENQLDESSDSGPRTICGSNLPSQVIAPNGSAIGNGENMQTVRIIDPNSSKRNGAPRKNPQRLPGKENISLITRKRFSQLFFSCISFLILVSLSYRRKTVGNFILI